MPFTNLSFSCRIAVGLVAATGVLMHGGRGRCEGAETAGDVEVLFKKGTELRRKGRDADALIEFQKAARLQDSPRAWAQVALAEQALGLWLDANTHIGRALESHQDAWILKNQDALEAAHKIIRTHLCQVEVWGAPAGAQVSIDGKRAGVLPDVTTWLDAGSVALEITATGFVPLAKTLNLPEGGRVREHADLRRPRLGTVVPAASVALAPPSENEPANGEPGAAAAAAAASSSDGSAPAGGSESRGGARSGLRPYAWATAAGAVAGIGFGVFETTRAVVKQNAFENHTGPSPANPTLVVQDCAISTLNAACKSISDAHDSAVKLAVVGYAVGGALAVGSVVLFVLSSQDDHPSDSALACVPDLLNDGVACRLRF